jgi:FMN phosphatase YigB (HAD superfamily)
VALFTAVLAQLGLPAHAILCVDDTVAHVEGARAAGMQACLFTSAAALRADLTAYLRLSSGVLPARPPTTQA